MAFHRHLTIGSQIMNRFAAPPVGYAPPIALEAPKERSARIEAAMSDAHRRALTSNTPLPAKPIESLLTSAAEWKRTVCAKIAALLTAADTMPIDKQSPAAVQAQISRELIAVAAQWAPKSADASVANIAALIATDLAKTAVQASRAVGASIDAQILGAQLEQSAAWISLAKTQGVGQSTKATGSLISSGIVGGVRPQFKSIGEHMISRWRDDNNDGKEDWKHDKNHDGKKDKHSKGKNNFKHSGSNIGRPRHDDNHDDHEDWAHDKNHDGKRDKHQTHGRKHSGDAISNGDEHLAALGVELDAEQIGLGRHSFRRHGVPVLIIKNKAPYSIEVAVDKASDRPLAYKYAIRSGQSQKVVGDGTTRYAVRLFAAGKGTKPAEVTPIYWVGEFGRVYRLVVRNPAAATSQDIADVTRSARRFLGEEMPVGDELIGDEWREIPVSELASKAGGQDQWIETPIASEWVLKPVGASASALQKTSAAAQKDEWVFMPFTREAVESIKSGSASGQSIGAEWTSTSHPRPGGISALAAIGAEQLIASHKKNKDYTYKVQREDRDYMQPRGIKDSIATTTTAPAQRPAHTYALHKLVSENRGLVRLDLPPTKVADVRISAVTAAGQRIELSRSKYAPIAAGVHDIEICRGNAAPKIIRAGLNVSAGSEYALCRDGKASVKQVVELQHPVATQTTQAPRLVAHQQHIAANLMSVQSGGNESRKLLDQYAPELKPIANSAIILHWQNGAVKQMSVAPIGEFLTTTHIDDYSLRANNGLEYSVHPTRKHVWDADFNEVPIRALFTHPASPSTTVMVIDHATMPSF